MGGVSITRCALAFAWQENSLCGDVVPKVVPFFVGVSNIVLRVPLLVLLEGKPKGQPHLVLACFVWVGSLKKDAPFSEITKRGHRA